MQGVWYNQSNLTGYKEGTAVSLFLCPICNAPLTRGERAYTCPKGHSFDIAREGYVHLLPANRRHSAAPGDDKGMSAARSRFLAAGYYEPLRQALCALALEHTGQAPAVLDAGCGEGYYTAGVFDALAAAGRSPRLAGVDLSKPSVRRCARQVPEGEIAVASVYHLPVGDGTVDLLLDCFSPLAAEEFCRVLRPGGVFLYVVPGTDHLWELKQVLYERPYRNREQDIPYQGFESQGVVPVEAQLDLPGSALQDLFQMTPYFWKTPRAGAQRLAALDQLRVTASFRIHVFRRQ